MKMDYAGILDYIDSFINFERIPQYSYADSFNLDRMYAFLQELDNPHQGLKTIHIAGSKGKGSTCAIIASLLKEAGYRVGLYTSPHLIELRERIRVFGRDAGCSIEEARWPEGMIGEDEFIALVERTRDSAEKFRGHKELGKLSFFEVLTACAFLYFKESTIDFAVLETGLGGRLDATNVTRPLVCGITNISMEHSDKLGSSLEAIAGEKAGIIKARGIVVSARQENKVIEVIKEVCREKEAVLYEIKKDIDYAILDSNTERCIFSTRGPGYSYKDLELGLLGAHQVENAVLAIAIAKKACSGIGREEIARGLKRVSWPGRLEVIRKEPYLILDGAQNRASIKAALSSVKELFDFNRFICIFGVCSDKDIKGMCRELDRGADVIILTKSSKNERAKDPAYLKKYFHGPETEVKNNIEEALNRAFDIADKNDLILVTGSLYLVGEAMGLQTTLRFSDAKA